MLNLNSKGHTKLLVLLERSCLDVNFVEAHRKNDISSVTFYWSCPLFEEENLLNLVSAINWTEKNVNVSQNVQGNLWTIDFIYIYKLLGKL